MPIKISPPNKPKIVEQEGNKAVFEVKPCYPGYGITLGNAFRRVLLSSLKGTAVTQVKIEGVDHEFSTIAHVKEDVIEIILNLKKLKFKMHGDEPIDLKLEAKGEKVVRGSNIDLPTDIELVNPKSIIANLTDKEAELAMEMKVAKGLGFVPAESRQQEQLPVGLIALNASFSPIKHINFETENVRVGRRTDFDKLILEIETDGTVEPKEAFVQAADLLLEQFAPFAHPEKLEKVRKEAEKGPSQEKEEKPEAKEKEGVKASEQGEETKASRGEAPDIDELIVNDLNLDTRIINALREARIKSVSNLAQKSEEQLLNVEGLGAKSVKLIRRELGKLGIVLENAD